MIDLYLASPYSHESRFIRKLRFDAVCYVVGQMTVEGLITFSPIAHYHPIADVCELPTDFEFYRNINFIYIRSCFQFGVLMLPGWDESIGVKGEISIAENLNKEIIYIKPSNYISNEILGAFDAA